MLVNVHKANTELSRLLQLVEQGEEIIIARAGKPAARLVSAGRKKPASRLGVDTSDWKVPDDFNDPLPDAILDAFWNGG